MTEYYQLSTDYELAYQLLSDGQSLAAWMVFNLNPLVFNTEHKQLRVFSICDDKLFIDGLKPPSDFSYEKYHVRFLLPIPDPTIALQHSLTAALNVCDELREQVAGLWSTIEKSEASYCNVWGLLKQADSKIEELLRDQVLGLTHENEKLKRANANLRQNYIAALSCDDESDQDYKGEIVSVMQRITTALGLSWSCSDYDPADYEKRIVTAIEGLQAENEVYKKAIDAMSPNFANIDKIQELEEKRDRSNADRAIQAKDQELRIAKNDIEKLDLEIERLREVLETVSSDAKVQIEGRDAALRGSAETFKELSSKIAILEDNLTRSESDRLAELTNIMRMVQALEKTPLDKQDGAISLIKRVIYDQICKLDPSQSWEF
jgi:hypothetical protein